MNLEEIKMIYEISGYSDDVVLLSCDGKHIDEFDMFRQDNILVKDPNSVSVARIVPSYVKGGCWCFAIVMIDEDTPIPEYINHVEVMLTTEKDYSTGLRIHSDIHLNFGVDE